MPNNSDTFSDIIITVIGSGTCVPSLKRSSCSALMTIRDKNLLFDIGPGTMRRLLEAGKTIYDISHVFISHFHPDHCGELATFLFSTKYPDISRRTRPLTLIGGKGFRQFFKKLKHAYSDWIDLPTDRLRIFEMDNTYRDRLDFDGFRVESIPVEHNPESIAYRINTPETSVVYSGDTDFTENLIELSKHADILICESALPDALKVRGHLTPSLAGEIASRAKVRKLMLTHFYPECDHEDIAGQCRKTYSGSLILAEDLMTIHSKRS